MKRPWRSPIEIPKLLKEQLKGKTFCEIGCGEGDLLKEFAKYADKAYGIEHNSKYFNALDVVDNECDNVEVIKKSIEIYQGQGGDIQIEDIPKADIYYFWISEGADEILIDKLPPSTMVIHKAGFNKPWLEKTFGKHKGEQEYIEFTSNEVCTYPNGWVCDETTPLVLGIFHKKEIQPVKIKFVVLGWFYEKYPELIHGLKQLKNENSDIIDVFYACHKDPPNIVKDNFEWQLFDNWGLEWGGFQQTYEYLKTDPNTIMFFMNDDLIIKDWAFINECLLKLESGYKVIGNGWNYETFIDPQSIITPNNDDPLEIAEPYGRVKKWIDVVKDKNKHIFDSPLQCKTIRGSFICIRQCDLETLGGFEVIDNPYSVWDASQEWGNISLNLFGYKASKLLGNNTITYLGNEYANSKYIHELIRGQ